jgi:hypothetical protein
VKRVWQGPHGETLDERYLVVARDRSWATALDIDGDPIELSPDASRLLANSADGRLSLVTIGTGEIEQQFLGARTGEPDWATRKRHLMLAGISQTPWGGRLAWHGSTPVFVKDGALLEPFGHTSPTPSGRIVAQGGSHLVVLSGPRPLVWDLNAARVIPSSLDDLPEEMKIQEILLSRDGKRLFAWCTTPRGNELCFMPVAPGRIDRYALPRSEEDPEGAWQTEFSFWAMPGGAMFRQRSREPSLVSLDYASGTFHRIPDRYNVNDVAPDARTFLQGWTNVIDLRTGKVVYEREHLRAFFDSEHLFGIAGEGDDPLREIVDVRTGAVTPYR